MNLRPLAAAATLAICSSAAMAQDAAPIPLTLTPGPGGTFATAFNRTVTGLFVDTFSFTPQSVAGTVSVRLTPGNGGPVNLFSALLNGEGFSFFPESGQSSFSFQADVSSGTPLSLTVFGFSGNVDALVDAAGAYSGTIGVVPEPAGLALMAFGLAVVGSIVRRRQRVVA